MKTTLKLWKRHFLWCELVAIVGLAVMIGLWLYKYGGASVVDSTLDKNRAAVYGALATICGSLLGFVITAASIVLGFSASERLAVVRESKHYATLWKVFTASIRALGFATIAALLGLILDRDQQPKHWVLMVAIFGTMLASARLLRCIWVIENIISLVSRPRSSPEPAPAGAPTAT